MIWNMRRRRKGSTPQPSELSVTLSGTFDPDYGYVTINGTTYTSAQTINFSGATEVSVFCGCDRAGYQTRSKITLNGTEVAQGTYYDGAYYSFAVTGRCTIKLTAESVNSYKAYSASITM